MPSQEATLIFVHAGFATSSRTAIASSVAAAVLGLCSCTRPVAIPVPSPTSSLAAQACDQLAKSVPATLLGKERRDVQPASVNTAAWGTPAITLRCGTSPPAGLIATSELITVNGVDWFPERRSAGFVFTTTGRVATIEVAVPDRYRPETNVLPELAGAVAAADPVI